MDWLQSYWGAVVALLVMFGGGPIAIAAYLQPQVEKHAELRDWIARWLVMPSLADGYRRWLGGELDRLDRWMEGHLSWTAFTWCLAIAFAYPVLLLLVTYGFGGPGRVGETSFLPDLGDWRQPLLGFGLIAVGTAVGLVIVFGRHVDQNLRGRIWRRLKQRGLDDAEHQAHTMYRLLGTIATAILSFAALSIVAGDGRAGDGYRVRLITLVIIAGTVGFYAFCAYKRQGIAVLVAASAYGVLAASLADMTLISSVFLLIVFIILGRADDVRYNVGISIFAMFAIFIYYLDFNELALVLLLSFGLLPVANALLDWWSWAASRWLGRDLHDLMSGKERALGRWLRRLFGRLTMPVAFAVHIGLDLLTAVFLLVALAGVLPFLIELFNLSVAGFGEPAPLELRGYLKAAVAHPWPDGAWALSMLLTTLIPTALHALVAFVTLFMWLIQPTDWRKAIVEGLRAEPVDGYAVLKATWLVILTLIVAAGVIGVIGWVLVEAVDLVWRPVAGILHDAAMLGIDAANDLARAVGMIPV